MTQEQIAPRVGVGWNGAKALPSVGAIRAGLINVVVTDEESAREVLAIVLRESAALVRVPIPAG